MQKIRKTLTIAGAALAVVAPLLLTATSAQAATSRNGTCETNEFCYYFNTDWKGSVSDFISSVGDYGTDPDTCYEFKGAGNGKSDCIKNAAASAWNRSSVAVTVYENSDYNRDIKGKSVTIAPGQKVNLVDYGLKNNEASHRFAGNTTGLAKLSDSLYKDSDAYISCGFDGYHSTPGRHEGIDIRFKLGAPVYALVAGKVIYVDRGATGSGGSNLSTISVYNSSLDKTIIYLHSAPISSLSVGDTISKGERIASESWRGAPQSGHHTHVEMRPGKHELAAKSVGDYTLSNPDPTSFWKSQGYSEA